ncbi:hypothetical protein HYH02_015417 [Chlamydomonas schloesseri]|uniref:Uncharacterized protein n=1 Tax=Chlamydomonas schloesseri TaxID=2026947 RepID=A0A835SMA0_9CHLO|nr:hypothetical protein HYH02_015417 [Chlamydomonas schloesseri]|eukprot:KAG2422571.1 hypothetical protein HYH02_015417 [Chlamydomonas schloesseri]
MGSWWAVASRRRRGSAEARPHFCCSSGLGPLKGAFQQEPTARRQPGLSRPQYPATSAAGCGGAAGALDAHAAVAEEAMALAAAALPPPVPLLGRSAGALAAGQPDALGSSGAVNSRDPDGGRSKSMAAAAAASQPALLQPTSAALYPAGAGYSVGNSAAGPSSSGSCRVQPLDLPSCDLSSGWEAEWQDGLGFPPPQLEADEALGRRCAGARGCVSLVPPGCVPAGGSRLGVPSPPSDRMDVLSWLCEGTHELLAGQPDLSNLEMLGDMVLVVLWQAQQCAGGRERHTPHAAAAGGSGGAADGGVSDGGRRLAPLFDPSRTAGGQVQGQGQGSACGAIALARLLRVGPPTRLGASGDGSRVGDLRVPVMLDKTSFMWVPFKRYSDLPITALPRADTALLVVTGAAAPPAATPLGLVGAPGQQTMLPPQRTGPLLPAAAAACQLPRERRARPAASVGPLSARPQGVCHRPAISGGLVEDQRSMPPPPRPPPPPAPAHLLREGWGAAAASAAAAGLGLAGVPVYG